MALVILTSNLWIGFSFIKTSFGINVLVAQTTYVATDTLQRYMVIDKWLSRQLVTC